MENKEKIKIVILAAGKGVRMKSDLPKALMKVSGKSMVKHLVESVNESGIDDKPVVIVGYAKEKVMKELGENYDYVIQNEQLGTAHALALAKEKVKDATHILVLYSDQPFVSSKTLREIINKSLSSEATITFATTRVPNFQDKYKAFYNFARILRKNGKIISIREHKDASEEERNITEVNAGCYFFKSPWLWENLKKIDNKNSQKEYYITDLFHIAEKDNKKVESIKIEPKEALAANSKEELEILEKFAV